MAMCGRYASFLSAEAIARIFGTSNPLPNLAPTWTWRRPWTRQSFGSSTVSGAWTPWNGASCLLHEGLEEARKPINARSENVAKSGMFKDASVRRRCLVPAPVYYEWRDDSDGKMPFAVARVDGERWCSAASGRNGSRLTASSCRPSPPLPRMRTSNFREFRTECR
jgi:putative SOS response-associated peptidase YedK